MSSVDCFDHVSMQASIMTPAAAVSMQASRAFAATGLDGATYFGEIKRAYLENNNDFNIVVDSFEYRSERDVSMPGTDVREIFRQLRKSLLGP